MMSSFSQVVATTFSGRQRYHLKRGAVAGVLSLLLALSVVSGVIAAPEPGPLRDLYLGVLIGLALYASGHFIGFIIAPFPVAGAKRSA